MGICDWKTIFFISFFYASSDQIYINNNIYTSNNNDNSISNLENENNIILLKWNNQLNACTQIFFNLFNIIEFDL